MTKYTPFHLFTCNYQGSPLFSYKYSLFLLFKRVITSEFIQLSIMINSFSMFSNAFQTYNVKTYQFQMIW